jgi:hypothetical protein
LCLGTSRNLPSGLKALRPPYDPDDLANKIEVNNAVQPCVDAMITNIDGTGFEIVQNDQSQVKVNEQQKQKLTAFFAQPWPGISFMTMRKQLRRDVEYTGNAYIEVIRNLDAVQDQAITPEELIDNLNEVTGLEMEAATPDERMDRTLEKQATMYGDDSSIEGYLPGGQAGGGGVKESLGNSGGAYSAYKRQLQATAKARRRANGANGANGRNPMEHGGHKVFPNRSDTLTKALRQAKGGEEPQPAALRARARSRLRRYRQAPLDQ